MLCCVVLFVSCTNVIYEDTQNRVGDPHDIKNRISERVISLRENGMFNSFVKPSTSFRSVTSDEVIDSNSEIQQVDNFISNPVQYLNTCSSSETTTSELNLVDKMLNESTVGDVFDAMAEISPEMAKDYLETCESTINSLNESTGRSALSLGDIKNITLRFADSSVNRTSRAIFASNLDWNTIYWYYGMCAVTISGLSAYKWCKWWKPWIGIAGLATAAPMSQDR